MSLQEHLDTIAPTYTREKYHGIAKVALYDLETGEHAKLRADEPGWAASIIKVPVMTAVLDKVHRGDLRLHDLLRIDHRLTLEEDDYVSTLPQGTEIPLVDCLYRMIINSDNEATNMLIEAMGGVEDFNDRMWKMGMNQSMLGHLLCYAVPRYTTKWNPDGNNITTPEDMLTILRHIYDPAFSSLSENVRVNADSILGHTGGWYRRDDSLRVKRKVGFISCPEDGHDSHEVGIVGGSVLFAIMTNKMRPKPSFEKMTDNTFGGVIAMLEPERSFRGNFASAIHTIIVNHLTKNEPFY